MTPPWFVAFYSFKGGVGRSLTLANVACALARRGKRVVVMDLDLEAPSLHTLPSFRPAQPDGRGAVDLARIYAKTGEVGDLSGLLQPCPDPGGGGRLWLLPAGHPGAAYNASLGELNWRRLHPRQGTAPFVAGLRARITAAVQPHYVLIDSRTGLSDVGGLSTHLLADEVVLVFNLTRACLEGTVRAYASMTEGNTTRRESALRVALVASPVPPGNDPLIDERIKKAAELMPLGVAKGRKVLRVHYDPGMVLSEELAVLNPDRFDAARHYRELCAWVQADNPHDPQRVSDEVATLRSTGRVKDAVAALAAWVAQRPDNAVGQAELGHLYAELGRTSEAVSAFRAAMAADPELAGVAFGLASALHELSDGTSQEESDRLLAEACDYYAVAADHAPDDIVYYNWGVALGVRAGFSRGDARRQLLTSACERYEKAVRIKPDLHEALYNWGIALDDLARDANGDERRRLFEQACERYQQAVLIKLDQHEALYNWGIALAALARDTKGDERRRLFEQACERYQQVVLIKPDKHKALHNWANTLLLLSYEVSPKERQALLEQARAHCLTANRIQPHHADYNLACVSSLLGDLDQAESLLLALLDREPEEATKALTDADLAPLWAARPELRDQIAQKTASSAPSQSLTPTPEEDQEPRS